MGKNALTSVAMRHVSANNPQDLVAVSRGVDLNRLIQAVGNNTATVVFTGDRMIVTKRIPGVVIPFGEGTESKHGYLTKGEPSVAEIRVANNNACLRKLLG